MYTNILAALDSSPRAEFVLRQAQELATQHSATLHLCRAVKVPLGIPVEAWALSADDLTTVLLDDAQRDLLTLQRTFQGPRPGGIYVRLGRPAQVICDLAETIAADLIIIGSHGFHAIDHLLGTTAARVVNHASCSVLVVRPPRG